MVAAAGAGHGQAGCTTQALIASPPQIEVAPKSTQTVRLVRTAKSAVSREESYRLLIDEIVDTSAALPASGVNVQPPRYSVPVFVSPAAMKPPRLTVTANVEGAVLHLNAQNSGGEHANISAMTLQNAGGDTVAVEPGLVGYVLVGQARDWKLPLPPEAAAKGPFVLLRCRVNGEDFSSKL